MDIVFIVQNLNQSSDSVGFDCIFEFNILKQRYGKAGNVRIFAIDFDESLHPGATIEPFSDFFTYYEQNPEALIIYHFCDGWIGIDDFLCKKAKNCIVRWHNNTVPWIYALDAHDVASDFVRGFEVMANFARTGTINFFVNSEFSRRQLEALGGPPSKIHTVFPASSFLYKNSSISSVTTRLKPPIDPDRSINLLFVSRIVPHKGHKHILSVASAVEKFSKRKVSVTFVGKLEQRFKAYWVELQDIADSLCLQTTFTGLVQESELIEHYQRCDVFLCISEHEGFGMPVFEAMRCNVPVVAWSSSAFSDLLVGHPLASSQFNVHHFAACVLAALDEDICRQVLVLQNRILETYTYDIVVNQLLVGVSACDSSGEKVPPLDLPAPVPLFADIVDHVKCLTSKISNVLGTSVEVFTHDTPANYMSLYDITVYKRLIKLLRKERTELTRPPVRRGELVEIHPRVNDIHLIMSGSSAQEVGNIDSLEDLLKFDDEVFVRLAYATILGRDPDRSGLTTYLRHVRNGLGKVEIIHALFMSEERCAFGRMLPEVEVVMQPQSPKPAILKEEELANRLFDISNQAQPLIADPIIDKQYLATWDTDEQRLAQIEEAVARLSRYLIPPLGEVDSQHPMGSIHHVDDLLNLNDRSFVEWVYKIILGRSGDNDGVKYWLSRLRDGLSRVQLLCEFAKLESEQPQLNSLTGLAELVATSVRGESLNNSVMNTVTGRLNRIQNKLGRLINQLVARSDEYSDCKLKKEPNPADSLLRLIPAAFHDFVGRSVVNKAESHFDNAAEMAFCQNTSKHIPV